jgi:ubiquinone/menaquinone biosynthesis C-methylase UbiE
MHEHRFHGDIARLRSPERLAWLEVQRVVELSLQGGNFPCVLDVGTGTGIFAEAFAGYGLDVTGLDANPEMLIAAQNLVPGVRFEKGTAESLPFPDAAFDLVFMGLLLHETDNHLKAMQEAARVTRRRVMALEWPYEKQEIGPGLDERLTEKQVNNLASRAGLMVRSVVHLQSLMLYLLEK